MQEFNLIIVKSSKKEILCFERP